MTRAFFAGSSPSGETPTTRQTTGQTPRIGDSAEVDRLSGAFLFVESGS